MLMNRMINHIRCYFAGGGHQIQIHLMVTFTMLCVKKKLVLIRWQKNFVARIQQVFYDNCRNSCTLIGLFLMSISRQTHKFIMYAMRQERENAI